LPTLYIVATPIGNLEDITLRALRTLREAKLIAAEDTRQTKRLLSTYNIKTPLTSYHEHNKLTKLDYLLNHLQQEDVALVCDGGMPGISDPGYELIVAANQQGIPVVAIPGPSVITTALAVSGLPLGKFIYVGFLSRKAGERRRLLKSIAAEDGTIVALEAPHRLQAALSDIRLVLGDRSLAVCRELTKLHEEVFRGSVSQAIDHFTEPRGEFTLVIEGKRDKDKPQLTEEVKRQLRSLRVSGRTAKQAIAEVAGETGLSKRALYQAWLESINVN
jgi:16S rRNA (cytidine1402-2'-O)-methyltransferase